LTEINLNGDVAGLGKMARDGGTPLPPTPLNSLLGAGSAKSLGKILMSKSLEVKI
jgi:hypothetical protein